VNCLTSACGSGRKRGEFGSVEEGRLRRRVRTADGEFLDDSATARIPVLRQPADGKRPRQSVGRDHVPARTFREPCATAIGMAAGAEGAPAVSTLVALSTRYAP